MIIFFGPAGAGKSAQGKMLAESNHWYWLSTGNLIRESNDKELLERIASGRLVSDDIVERLIKEKLADLKDYNHVILDGFPRLISQAKWLMDSQDDFHRTLKLVVSFNVPHDEIIKRLTLRGRNDDKPEIIKERSKIYAEEVTPVLDYLENEANIKVVNIDGTGTFDEVHQRIEGILKECKLV